MHVLVDRSTGTVPAPGIGHLPGDGHEQGPSLGRAGLQERDIDPVQVGEEGLGLPGVLLGQAGLLLPSGLQHPCHFSVGSICSSCHMLLPFCHFMQH